MKKEKENGEADLDAESEEEKKDEKIGELTRPEYLKKYKVVSSNNYATANFSGVLEFDRDDISPVEKEAEQ